LAGGTSSIPGACFNFINSIVGAGIIGLPFAVKEAGFGLGLCLLFFCGLVTDFSVRLLVSTANKVGCKDYEAVCQVAFGKAGYYLVSFFMFIFAFGAMIAYFCIIGDTITSVFGTLGAGGVLVNRSFIILICAFLIILPISSFRDMSTLSNTSAISVACDIIIVFLVCIKCLAGGETATPVPHVPSAAQHPKGVSADPWDFAHAAYMEAFGAMCFAYVCHHSSFLVFQSLKNPTQKRWNIVTHSSIGTAIVLSMALSIAGYSRFQLDTQANVLNNFPQVWMSTFPLPCRSAVFTCSPFPRLGALV